MIALWIRFIGKKYQISVELGEAELKKCPDRYYDAVVEGLKEEGWIKEEVEA